MNCSCHAWPVGALCKTVFQTIQAGYECCGLQAFSLYWAMMKIVKCPQEGLLWLAMRSEN